MKMMKTILNESVFNPDIQGPLKIVFDVADPRYYELRALELIQEARQCINRIKMYNPDHIVDPVRELEYTYHEKLKQAISLLAMARAYESFGEEKLGTI